jgi:hypothetical protein
VGGGGGGNRVRKQDGGREGTTCYPRGTTTGSACWTRAATDKDEEKLDMEEWKTKLHDQQKQTK